ncbi:hypothetical protein [Acetobacter tropicalis]|uniref:hypothetical protein n=1 Tax=Acetobacter tropicalis TaxID=104102 RepID=UPI000586EE1F|nr:hypothetical protein [Acetobacter tropicalis]
MNTDTFFKTLIDNTLEQYKKIPKDLERNYNNYGSLTVKQAQWIETALTRNKALRELEIPDEIQTEMDIALGTSDVVLNDKQEKTLIDRDELNQIILEEIANAITRVMERISIT